MVGTQRERFQQTYIQKIVLHNVGGVVVISVTASMLKLKELLKWLVS